MTTPTHQNALPLGSMLMEYRLASVLGAGGFGITYLAHDTNLEKDVAIKEYLPGAVAVRGSGGAVLPTTSGLEKEYRWGLDRFIQEARTLAKFSHPHIVRVNRFFEANGTGYMVMDYEAGESLKAWLQRNPFPPEPTLRAMLAPLLDGLEKVHAAGFLHRDIKPDNIFIRKDGGPVLIDFGSARQAVAGASQALTTIVSPGYAPFEQYTTSAEQGPWSDIYSLSGVLYFAVDRSEPTRCHHAHEVRRPDPGTGRRAECATAGRSSTRSAGALFSRKQGARATFRSGARCCSVSALWPRSPSRHSAWQRAGRLHSQQRRLLPFPGPHNPERGTEYRGCNGSSARVLAASQHRPASAVPHGSSRRECFLGRLSCSPLPP